MFIVRGQIIRCLLFFTLTFQKAELNDASGLLIQTCESENLISKIFGNDFPCKILPKQKTGLLQADGSNHLKCRQTRTVRRFFAIKSPAMVGL